MMNYILIGILFMFCVEYLLNKKTIQKQLTYIPNLGWTERIIGIIAWPFWLGVFLYNFFKTLFK